MRWPPALQVPLTDIFPPGTIYLMPYSVNVLSAEHAISTHKHVILRANLGYVLSTDLARLCHTVGVRRLLVACAGFCSSPCATGRSHASQPMRFSCCEVHACDVPCISAKSKFSPMRTHNALRVSLHRLKLAYHCLHVYQQRGFERRGSTWLHTFNPTRLLLHCVVFSQK